MSLFYPELQGQGLVWRLVRSLPSRETETGQSSGKSVVHRKSCIRATHKTIPARSRKVKLQCYVTPLRILVVSLLGFKVPIPEIFSANMCLRLSRLKVLCFSRWQGAQALQAGDAGVNLNDVITFSGGWLVDQIPQVNHFSQIPFC